MTDPTLSPAWHELLTHRGGLIGMVHLGALPGTPKGNTPVRTLVERAVAEAGLLRDAGFDGIIVENMHDAPYVHGDELGPEIVASVTLAVARIRDAISLPVGVQILSGGNRHALAAALTSGGSFIRCENFVFAHVADEGMLPKAEAGELLRYRRRIGADHIGVFCDIKKKHASHAITSDISIEETAAAAAFFGADALIVTGSSTGKPADPREVVRVAGATALPVLVGSGVTPESIGPLIDSASALIVGSSIKVGGVWSGAVDPAAAERLVVARDHFRS